MEIAQLRYFLAASESENFTAAAKQCYTSRQNLTRSIRNLEDELGTTLFTRTGNKTYLTGEGERAVEHARAISDEARILEDLFKGSPEAATLRVLLSTNSNLFLPKRVFDEAFLSNCLISEHSPLDCFRQIVQGAYDVAFVGSMSRGFPGCSDVLIRKNPLFYLVSEGSPLANRTSLGIRDLDGHELCVMSDPAFAYQPFLTRYRELGMDTRQIHVIANIPLLRNEMRAKDAIAFGTPEFQLRPLSGTVAVPCAEDFMVACMYALYQRGSEHVSDVLRLVSCVRKLSNEAYGPSC